MKCVIFALFFIYAVGFPLRMSAEESRENGDAGSINVRAAVIKTAVCATGLVLSYVGIKRYLYSDSFESRWRIMGNVIKELVEEQANLKKPK